MGLPCEGAADCALREFSPFWGPPSHDKKTVEECNDDGGLVRKKDAFRVRCCLLIILDLNSDITFSERSSIMILF